MDKLERQEQIYRTAARLFFTQGYHDTTMRKLAREIGIDPGLLYFYYKSKNDLLYNIVRRGVQELIQGTDAALESATTPSEQMSLALTSHIRYHLRRKEEVGLDSEIRHLEPEQQSEIRNMTRAYIQKYSLILDRGIKEGVFRPCNVPLTTLLLLSNAASIAVWYHPGRTINEDEVIASYVEHAMHSLR
jgi:AcrR family transcriptional regulator